MTTAGLPSSMGAQMGMAQSQHSAQDVQDKSRAIDNLKRGLNAPKDKAKKLREACEGFESVFIQKMWEQMRATVPKGGMLQGRDEQYWQGMFDQELSKKMSSAGGIGLADMMYEQLSRNLVSASRTTASGLGAAANAATQAGDMGFVASAAPLLPPMSQNAPDAKGTAVAAATGSKNAPAGIYGQEAVQPEAAQPESGAESGAESPQMVAGTQTAQPKAQGQSADGAANTAPPALATGAQAQAAAGTPPEVQQVLEQLRAQSGMATTMTGAQAIAAVQAMTPAQALALSQGMSWSQVQGMQANTAQLASAAGISPEMLGQAGAQGQTGPQAQASPSGLDNARAAAQSANTRMPAGGVLPPMTPMQRQARMNYSAAKVQGKGTSTQTHSPQTQPPVTQAPVATAPDASGVVNAGAVPAAGHATLTQAAAKPMNTRQDSTMPANPNLGSNVQGTPGVSPTKFVQNSPLIASAPAQTAGADSASMGMTGEQIAALTGQGQPQTIGQMVGAAPMQVPATPNPATIAANGQQSSPAIPPTAQEPQIINTTFTTNVPPSRRNGRAGQRVPKGQAVIRTLNAGGQG